MADTNFVEINPSAANTENDAAYQADGFVTGGAAVDSFWDSPTANKFFIQNSRMIAALAKMLVAKGYSPVDGTTPFTPNSSFSTPVNNLATVLANIMTAADVVQASSFTSGGGYIKFGTAFGGLILQWGTTASLSSGAHTISFPISFPTNFPAVLITVLANVGPIGSVLGTTGGQFTLNNNTSGATYYWFAIGN